VLLPGWAEPASRLDLFDCVLERGGRDVVAFVDDDEPIPRCQFGDVVSTGECLKHGNVNDAKGFGAAAAQLAGLDSEMLVKPDIDVT